MQKAIRILYPITFLAKEGPTNQLYYLLKYFNRTLFEPVILTLSPEPENSMKKVFEEMGVPVYSLNLPPRFGGIIAGPAKFKKTIIDLKPDIIHSFGFRADVLTAYFLKDFKRILSIRGYHFREYPLNEGPVLGTLMALMHFLALKRSDFLVACSKSIESEMKHFGLSMTVIQNGVDREPVPITASKRASLRIALALPLDRKIYISVGFLSKRKDPETVIKGFLSSSAGKDGFLLFLGEGQLRARCEELGKGHDNLKFLGFVPNVYEYLMASDYIISASLSEGMPNTILEAFTVGLPACLSDILPHQEILKLNNNAGMLFPVKNVTALAKRIDQLTASKYEIMQQAALNTIADHLNAKKMSEKYQWLYSQVAKKKIPS